MLNSLILLHEIQGYTIIRRGEWRNCSVLLFTPVLQYVSGGGGLTSKH